jgi:hypothetical protein
MVVGYKNFLIALTFYGPCPDGMTVDHNDRVKINNRVRELGVCERNCWGTKRIGDIPPLTITTRSRVSNKCHCSETRRRDTHGRYGDMKTAVEELAPLMRADTKIP